MAHLCSGVKAGCADIGFARDGDGERLGIVTELGQPLSEELTFALATRIRLEQKTGNVVTNISTTSAIEQIAAAYEGTVVRTPVGQTYISEGMIELKSVLGGEGSGGGTVAELNFTHDSAAAVGLIFEGLAREGGPGLEILAERPQIARLKQK